MKTMVRLFLALCTWAPLFFSIEVRAETIAFGVVGAQSQESLAAMWSPLFDALQEATGIAVKPVFGKDYQIIVDGMNRGDIQVASFGNRSALDVVDDGQGEIFAQWVDDQGRRGYVSHLIALKTKRWRSFDDAVKDAKRIRFAFGDPKSTSGTLVPQYYLFAQRKVKAEDIFAKVSHGNHERNIEAVLARKVDVATVSSQVLDPLAAKDPQAYARLRILWTSPLIPQDAIIWRKDLPTETKRKLRAFFLSFGNKPEKRRLLQERMGLSGFAPSDDRQLIPVRQLELYRQRQAIEADTGLPPLEQFRRLMEIDARLAVTAAAARRLESHEPAK